MNEVNEALKTVEADEAVDMPSPARHHMSTLGGDWRFTLPASLRQTHGWREGMRLCATASGQFMMLTEAGGSGRRRSAGDCAGRVPDGDPSAECRVGAGGKLVVPASLRKPLRWEPGKRLVAQDKDGAVSISPCCSIRRCRSCGSVEGVREIIPNLYLCKECWGRYSRAVRRGFHVP